MSKKAGAMRIAGLYNARTNAWDKLIYVHVNAEGKTCVNGEPTRLSLCKAGHMPGAAGGDYAIVLPENLNSRLGQYLAVGAGETLFRMGGPNEEGALSVVNSGFVAVSTPVQVWREMNVGVLTVSDKGYAGEREDTAGPALADMACALGSRIVHRDIVPDDRTAIADKLREWSDERKLQLILTTGGTGLSKRDVTPEALMDVQEKLVPGFGEIMRTRSMLYTERGFLTRSLAVVRGSTLIIAFPGSERAVRQCFEAIAGSLRHGVEILSGWDAECGTHAHG